MFPPTFEMNIAKPENSCENPKVFVIREYLRKKVLVVIVEIKRLIIIQQQILKLLQDISYSLNFNV